MQLYYSNLKRQTTQWFLKFLKFANKASDCLPWKALDWQAQTHRSASSFYEGKLTAFGDDRWLWCILPVVNLLKSEVHLLCVIAWAVTMATSVSITAHLCSSQSWPYRGRTRWMWQTRAATSIKTAFQFDLLTFV